MTRPARHVADDPLIEELLRRRAVAISAARNVVGRQGVDEGASLFLNLHAAKTCDDALQMLARLGSAVPA